MRVDGKGRRCQVSERRRRHSLGDDAHLIRADLFNAIDPADKPRSHILIARIGGEAQRVDHVVGIESGAVMKSDPFTQLEFQRFVVYPAPGGCQLTLKFTGVGIAIDQRVPDRMRKRLGGTATAKVFIEARKRLLGCKANGVVFLVRECGRCERGCSQQRGSDDEPESG